MRGVSSYREFGRLVAPLLASNILQAASITAAGLYLGYIEGAVALAAISAFLPMHMFLVAVLVGFSTGCSIVAAQVAGQGDAERTGTVIRSTIAACLAFSTTIALIGLLTLKPFLVSIGTPPELVADALKYGSLMLLAFPLSSFTATVAALLRGMGDAVTPLRGLALSCLSLLVLCPLLLGGTSLGSLGVRGAALAYAGSATVGVLWSIASLRRYREEIRVSRRSASSTMNPDVLRRVAAMGAPTSLFFIVMAGIEAAILHLVNGYGTQATAAYGAVNQIMVYVQFPATSVAVAATLLAAKAVGAGRARVVLETVRVATVFNAALAGSVCAMAYLCSSSLTLAVLNDHHAAELAAGGLRKMALGSVIFGFASVLSGAMRAAGSVRVPTMISLACLLLLLVPLATVLTELWGLKHLWAAYPITYFTALILQVAYFSWWTARTIS